jgi:hypothetical protein
MGEGLGRAGRRAVIACMELSCRKPEPFVVVVVANLGRHA